MEKSRHVGWGMYFKVHAATEYSVEYYFLHAAGLGAKSSLSTSSSIMR